MAITTMTAVNTALPGLVCRFQKTVANAGTTPSWAAVSAWTVSGLPGQGAAPSSGIAGDVPTDATTGAYPFTNPASGNTYIGRLNVRDPSTTIPSQHLMIYDRLWHNSGISPTSTSGQTVNSVALTRPDVNGVNAEAWWEVTTVMGAGTPTVTLAYTNSGGTTRTTGTSGVLVATMPVGRTGQFMLVAGDIGVKSIQTWTASATFTSGNIHLVIRRCLTSLTISPIKMNRFNAVQLAMPRVYDDACLELIWHTFSNQTFLTMIDFSLIQG